MSADILLEAENLSVNFRVPGRGLFRYDNLRAITNVSFSIREGETLGVVGESGCGKSTLARAALRLVKLSSGRLLWRGQDTGAMPRKLLDGMRRHFQIIFQDPFSSLNPRMRTGQLIGEPLLVFEPRLSPERRTDKVLDTMGRVGLHAGLFDRYPHELSGGQAQRVSIARALACSPRLVVCDEPVSALDVSVQAQILNLLDSLRRTENLALMFISHDLSVVRHISDRVMVLYLGRIVEMADRADLFDSPLHPYTRALLNAAPVADPKIARARKPAVVTGEPPSPVTPPSGCAFHVRCPHCETICADALPPLEHAGTGENVRQVACHRWQEIRVAPSVG